MREVRKTEDPNGSIITVDTCDQPPSQVIWLWSADFHYLAAWCFQCKRFHAAP